MICFTDWLDSTFSVLVEIKEEGRRGREEWLLLGRDDQIAREEKVAFMN